MNNRGTSSIVAFMIGVVCLVLGIALAYPISSASSDAQTLMNCSNTTLTYSQKADCVSTDMATPLLVGTLIGIAGFALTKGFF